MTFYIYRALTFRGWRYRWRLKADNHKIIAHSGEDYHNKNDCVAMVEKMVNELETATIKLPDVVV